MAQTIVLKRSSQPNKRPEADSLNLGEIAINTYDGKLFIKRSGSVTSVEELIVTNVVNTGSIFLTATGSFGELVISKDANVQQDLYVIRDVITNGDIDVAGDISGSGIQINDTLNITHNEFHLSASVISTGSFGILGNLTVDGAINAKQFNINVISSSIIFESGSSKFGNTFDDTHSFTGSVSVTGSLSVNGTEVGVAPGPNTFDFNLDPDAAGTVNYIEDSTAYTRTIAKPHSIDITVGGNTVLSVSGSAMNVISGSKTANFMHLVKYINPLGDLDFNI